MDFLADADEDDDFLTPKHQANAKSKQNGHGGLTSLFAPFNRSSADTSIESGNDFKYKSPKKHLGVSQGIQKKIHLLFSEC